MRKKLITPVQSDVLPNNSQWLLLEQLAAVEVSSEEATYPIEGALLEGNSRGWRASEPGEQLVRIVFDHPQTLKWIQLRFVEHDVERTQEFVLRWSADAGKTLHEIVRQQWNFDPQTAPQQSEDYEVDLTGVTVLELRIVPDVNGGDVRATLDRLRLA